MVFGAAIWLAQASCSKLSFGRNGGQGFRGPLVRHVGFKFKALEFCETMVEVAESAREHLRPLIGLRLSASYRAADMRVFHFGRMHVIGGGAVGEYALHVQCPWRIETEDRIITGHDDLFLPAEETEDFDWESWDWDGGETLQDRLVSDFLAKTEPSVQDLNTDRYGGAKLSLSGGYSLVLFPADSQGEDWRVFKPNSEGEHFVVSGGRVEK
jgi:hypothetical protein